MRSLCRICVAMDVFVSLLQVCTCTLSVMLGWIRSCGWSATVSGQHKQSQWTALCLTSYSPTLPWTCNSLCGLLCDYYAIYCVIYCVTCRTWPARCRWQLLAPRGRWLRGGVRRLGIPDQWKPVWWAAGNLHVCFPSAVEPWRPCGLLCCNLCYLVTL